MSLSQTDEDTILAAIRDIHRGAEYATSPDVSQFGYALADLVGQILNYVQSGTTGHLEQSLLEFSMRQLSGGLQ